MVSTRPPLSVVDKIKWCGQWFTEQRTNFHREKRYIVVRHTTGGSGFRTEVFWKNVIIVIT